MQLDETILKAFGSLQVQRHVTGTTRYQWNAVPNKHRDHTDHKLVDRVLVKKRGDELAATHQPDVLAGLVSKPAYVWTDGAVHKLHAWRNVGRWRVTGKDDVSIV